MNEPDDIRIVPLTRPHRAPDPALPFGRRPARGLSIGIGVTTYNRVSQLGLCLDQISRRTAGRYTLVVADDGSSDGTLEMLGDRKVACISGRNMGIAWNKNRLLYTLHVTCGCDVSILIEDDTVPVGHDWNIVWIEAALRWGHANFAGPWFRSELLIGRGTLDAPFVSRSISGQVACFSRAAIAAVGYMDTRFGARGYEHADHSERLVRAGFGGEMQGHPHFYLIDSDVHVGSAGSYRDEASVSRNAAVLEQSRTEFFYRPPFRTEHEYHQFKAEIAAFEPASAVAG